MDFQFDFGDSSSSINSSRGSGGASSSGHRTSARKVHQTYHPPGGRLQFCAANNRFVLSPLAPALEECLLDADAALPWGLVEQAIVPVENTLVCPICLDELRLPQLTRCGHVFCLTCALRFLSYAEDGPTQRPCPVWYVPGTVRVGSACV